MLADGWRYQCAAVVRMVFQTRLLELLYIHRPVNLVVFKSSPHVLEPASVGQSSEGAYGQTCESCGLHRGPIILHSRPLSPDAKLSLECEPSNPAKPRIERLKIPGIDRYGYCIFYAGLCLMPPDLDNSKGDGNRVYHPQFWWLAQRLAPKVIACITIRKAIHDG